MAGNDEKPPSPPGAGQDPTMLDNWADRTTNAASANSETASPVPVSETSGEPAVEARLETPSPTDGPFQRVNPVLPSPASANVITIDPRTEETPPQPKRSPVPVAEWKVVEPADPSEPVPHELAEFQAHPDGDWHLLAASLRGRLHAHKGMWREDAYACAWVAGWTIVVLSDGAGSAKFARIASRIASSMALESVKKSLADFCLVEGDADTPTKEDQIRLRSILTKGALDARYAVVREKDKRGCQVRDLNTTFLLMVYAPYKENALVGALQVGDGAIGVFTEDEACTVLGSADHGQYSSETRFLTDAGIDLTFSDRVQFRCFKKNLRALAVMCDGVSDDFFPENTRLVELFIGNPIPELKMKRDGKHEPVYGVMHPDNGLTRNPQEGRALLDWLRYEKRGSSDDRTLVLLYRSEKK